MVIVAGGCDDAHKDAVQAYGDLLDAAFADFHGMVISGGTEQGISGLVAGSHSKHKRPVSPPLGYLPHMVLPADQTATRVQSL